MGNFRLFVVAFGIAELVAMIFLFDVALGAVGPIDSPSAIGMGLAILFISAILFIPALAALYAATSSNPRAPARSLILLVLFPIFPVVILLAR